MEAEKNEERNDEKMRIDIERNTDSEKRLREWKDCIC